MEVAVRGAQKRPKEQSDDEGGRDPLADDVGWVTIRKKKQSHKKKNVLETGPESEPAPIPESDVDDGERMTGAWAVYSSGVEYEDEDL